MFKYGLLKQVHIGVNGLMSGSGQKKRQEVYFSAMLILDKMLAKYHFHVKIEGIFHEIQCNIY